MVSTAQRIYQVQWREANRSKCRKASRKHYQLHSTQIRTRQAEFRAAHRKEIAVRNKVYNQKVREEVLRHYSNGSLKCACCGEDTEKFLSIDHINGGGAAHRREIQASGWSFYLWLRSNSFPVGFQVLCYNCNMSKGFHGVCPHQQGNASWPRIESQS